jgi:hypothetical protein
LPQREEISSNVFKGGDPPPQKIRSTGVEKNKREKRSSSKNSNKEDQFTKTAKYFPLQMSSSGNLTC